jgi:hypothetical protein
MDKPALATVATDTLIAELLTRHKAVAIGLAPFDGADERFIYGPDLDDARDLVAEMVNYLSEADETHVYN